MKRRVAVAMSGGVDSAVCAGLLKDEGFEVIGITMCFNIPQGEHKKPSCCGIEGIEDARRASQILDIPHYVLNFGKALQEAVIKDFVLQYLRGRTPNPCICCNQFVKFDALLKRIKQFDADFLATGHYARIAYDKQKKIYFLKKAKDKFKDQSYFLYSIKKQALPHILFPLGDYTKPQVRQIARQLRLNVAEKPGSQEICFVASDYREFLERELPRIFGTRITANLVKPGPIIDTQGNILGQHKGIPFYTIGQREGLGLSLGHKAYIIKIDQRKNTLVVGDDKQLYAAGLLVEQANFIARPFPKKPLFAKVKIRYNHKEAPSRIIPLGRKRLRVEFSRPQRAVTPGQSAVFYTRDTLLGGGIILEKL